MKPCIRRTGCMILSVIPIVGRILQFAVPQNSPVYTLAALLILVSGACCFYTGKLGMGILYTLTGGLFSIGNIYDIIQRFVGHGGLI